MWIMDLDKPCYITENTEQYFWMYHTSICESCKHEPRIASYLQVSFTCCIIIWFPFSYHILESDLACRIAGESEQDGLSDAVRVLSLQPETKNHHRLYIFHMYIIYNIYIYYNLLYAIMFYIIGLKLKLVCMYVLKSGCYKRVCYFENMVWWYKTELFIIIIYWLVWSHD